MRSTPHRLAIIATTLVALLILPCQDSHAAAREDHIRILCYHDIPKTPATDQYSIDQHTFAQQLEYLRTHGFHFISVEDLIEARKGSRKLPPKPVLLTFDDAYLSFYDFVFPLLRRLGYPSVLAVVGSWIENGPPAEVRERLMTWEQIRQVAASRLVEIASHSFDLHRGIQYTPQGNVSSAVAVRRYLPGEKRYEDNQEYRSRISRDFSLQRDLFLRRLGSAPRVMVWPYGRYNVIAIEEAKRAGVVFTFGLEDGLNSLSDLDAARRILPPKDMKDFIRIVEKGQQPAWPIHAVQADLDLLYDPQSPEQTDRNLGLFIERLLALGVNTVFLQAFSDPEGTGEISSVYFHNRVLPVRADIFAHAVHQITIRGIKVYAWMPTLGIVLPDPQLNSQLQVLRKQDDRAPAPYPPGQRRLTPFSPETRRILGMLYEDLAAHSLISGILFQDDATLSDQDDFSPYAAKVWERVVRSGPSDGPVSSWARAKTKAICDLLDYLADRVRDYRPDVKIARNIFAPPLLNPRSEEWFAHNYPMFLDRYDYVVVMAYPEMEEQPDWKTWLGDLVDVVRQAPEGAAKTVIKLQAYDWKTRTQIDDLRLLSQMRLVQAFGARNIAYYPDNVFEDHPAAKIMAQELSTKDFPFAPER